jgi:predicted nucleic acid-binding protein
VIVVADTSVLVNLCQIRQIELVARLFQEVLIPPEVASEFERLARQAARFQGLHLPAWIRIQTASHISAVIHAAGLDPGEAAALALALEIHADALLVDERRGHDLAVQLGMNTIGVLGILLQSKKSGFVSEVRPLLDALQSHAHFWIAPAIRQRVLALAGE